MNLEYLESEVHPCLSRVSSFIIYISHLISVLFHHSFCLTLKVEAGFAVRLITRKAVKSYLLEEGKADAFNQQIARVI